MRSFEAEDTIAALATPSGRSALGMVRISGRDCRAILPQIFVPRHGEITSFRPILGKVILGGERHLDEAFLTYFETPHSYTREDLAELTCHGNPLILDTVLERILACGARLARPGEFTYRAFLNGRLDLVQAEAVADLISSDSIYQTELALSHLEGSLSKRFGELRARFLDLISLLEGNLDFSEEQHYEFIRHQEALEKIESISAEMRSLLGSFDRGRMIREGFHVVLVGKPNVGKSSLFNALLGNDRAIVTPVPGTTRDYLQERIVLGNHLIYVIDTAGIHESSEPVERLGIERSRERIERADLIVFVVDGSSQIDSSDEALWKITENRERVVVANKSDVAGFSSKMAFASQTLPVSAKTGAGIETLLEWIAKRAEDSVRFSGRDSVISNLRHRDILKQSLECLDRARQSLEMKMSEEFPLVDLHQAMNLIGEIVGEVTVDDIYQQIFSRFCIGK